MKKILSIISAVMLALVAFSCVKEERMVIDTSKATAPVMLEAFADEDGLSVQYTPAVFNRDFNEKMATYHTLAIVAVNGKAVNQTLVAKDDGEYLSVTGKSITSALTARGFKPFDEVGVDVVVRGSIQDPSRGVTNGYVDSQSKFSFTWIMPEPVEGCPYEDYTDDSEWSLIGKMTAYGIDWNGDLNMWTDGTSHVAAHVTLMAGDEVKFRKDQSWTVNMGGDMNGLDSEFSVTQDGNNIKITADGVYDLYLDPNAGTAIVTNAYDPYPDYTEPSEWSVIGAIAAYNNEWNKDLPMVSNGTSHAAFNVIIGAADEFKFRKDAGWAVNMGGEFGGIGSEISVTQDGANIKVGADGLYDLFLNPDAGTAIVEAASGLKVSSVIGGDEPEPEPEPEVVTGWNIIGLNGDWENDVIATQDGNLWTAYITATDATEFKWRKDGDWAENYGGTMAAFGEPFAAEAGGNNISVPAGFYKVVLDTENLTITVYNDFTVWSLIGDFNSWGGDIDMVEADGKWIAEDVVLSGGWKIRKNHDWAENRGGDFVALGEPFSVSNGGNNIDCGEGKFTVVYDPASETITVSEGTVWSLIGDFNSWGGDIDMVEADGKWIAEGVELTGGWKIRKNHDWAENRGGVFVAYGEPFAVVNNGDNINCGEGKFNVVYDPAAETITVSTAVFGWSVIGVNGDWGTDIDMVEVMPGIWMSSMIEVTSEGWKIRYNHDWAVNRGNPELNEAGLFLPGVQDGGNVPLTGTFKVVYNANNGTLGTLVWGVVGTINGWGGDVPMNLGVDGKWYSIPVTLTAEDEIKIRKNADWAENFGGDFAEADTPFAAVAGGNNMKPGEGTFMVIYDPVTETLSLSKLYWGIVGEFSGWGGNPDVYMLPVGDGTWGAYGLEISGPWKIRQGSDWSNNRGGTFAEKGAGITAVPGGDNLTVEEVPFGVVYDTNTELIFVL